MESNSDYNILARLKTNLIIFPFLTGILIGITNGIYILISSQHLFWNILDKFTFLIISILIYSSVGIFIALFFTILPVNALFKKQKASHNNLISLYLSFFIVLLLSSGFLMKVISFSLFTLHLTRNILITISTILVGIILVYLFYSRLKNSTIILNVYTQISKIFNKKISISLTICLLFVISLNYVINNRFYSNIYFNSKTPNVIFISLDTLGANHLSSYGYSKKTSPYIDKMATQGVLFEEAFSHSKWTLPSHMSMMTSTYPYVHGVNAKEKILDSSFVTMAEMLKQNGYYCGAFVDRNKSSHIGADHGFDQGFDFYEHFPERFNRYEKLFVLGHMLNFVEEFLLRYDIPIVHSEKFTNEVLSWLEHYSKRKPFFLFLHYDDIHSEAYSKLPYLSPTPYNTMHMPEYQGDITGCDEDGDCSSIYLTKLSRKLREDPYYVSKEDIEYIVSLYDGGISYVDYQIGMLLEGIEKLGIDENTLIIVTSDHGEAFLEHGIFLHGQFYDEIIKVPLIMKYPGILPAGKRIKPIASLIDIFPTVLDLLNIKTIDQIQGTSLLPSIFQDTKKKANIVFGGLDKRIVENMPTRFVRTDSFKLITRKFIDSGKIRKELYNLNSDPIESINILEEETEIANKLEKYLTIWDQDCENLRESIVSYDKPPKTLELDEKTMRELKSLGYIK